MYIDSVTVLCIPGSFSSSTGCRRSEFYAARLRWCPLPEYDS